MDHDGLADLMAYDELCARIYADPRTREGDIRNLLLTLGWVILRDPGRRFRNHNWFTRCAQLLDGDPDDPGTLRRLVDADAPRYERPHRWAGPCEGPRTRAYRPRDGRAPHPGDPRAADDRVCGEPSRQYCIERDPVTGRHTQHWFCNRHRARLDEVKRRYAALDAPPPVPNRGGLLPSYFVYPGWERIYLWARPHWTPPAHGLRADDWPDPNTATTARATPRRPRLSLIPGGLAASPPDDGTDPAIG